MWRTRKKTDFLQQCLLATVTLCSLCVLGVANASCGITEGHYQDITIDNPATLSVSNSVANGTVLYRSEGKSIEDIRAVCDTGSFGVENEVGQPGVGAPATFPIGTTGLGFRWYSDVWGYLKPLYPMAAITVTSLSGNFALELVKIGPIQAGAKVPSGMVATYKNGTVQQLGIMLGNTTVINTPTCTTPSVKVDMGSQKSTGFTGLNTRLTPVNAYINLNACPAGITTVKYRLDPITEVLDVASSVIALSGDSTATGVGVQILDHSNQPLPLGQDIRFTGYDSAGGSFVIPFNVAYYQVASTIKGGTADASLTFTMTYE